ncbi:MAG TPA: hypothetical protein VH092_06500 [Urbifossiella sp.]|jgi:hypothetical protein|nr:hypothetical protein [Urbifossiella sp.]
MEVGDTIQSVFINEARKQIRLLILYGRDLWPDGCPEPLPESVYPEAFVAYLKRGGGTPFYQVWPDETHERCGKLAVALWELPEAAKSLRAALLVRASVVTNPFWVSALQSLITFGEEYSPRRRTFPEAGQPEGSGNPYALLDLASLWRKTRSQLELLEISLMFPVAAPDNPSALQNHTSVEQGGRRKPVTGSNGAGPDAVPRWVTKHFRQKQHDLLHALFSDQNKEATEENLCEHLGYTNPENKSETLDRRVRETNRSLLDRAETIGETWQIRERTRMGTKSYYLDRQK